MSSNLSNLDLLNKLDSFPYADQDADAYRACRSSFFTLLWNNGRGQNLPIGYVLEPVLEAILTIPQTIRGDLHADKEARAVTVRFTEETSEPERTARINHILTHLRDQAGFASLGALKGELSPVYASDNVSVLFSVDRAATDLLGVMRWGVHLTAYVVDDTEPEGIKIWVAKRAVNKKSYPGMLDNAAAGGLATGESPFEGILREAEEEASLDPEMLRERVHFLNTVTYMHVAEDKLPGAGMGFIHPECMWCYEVELKQDVTPIPRAGEVEEYRLCSVAEVKKDLAEGRYKPNCAVIMLDFLVKRGVINEANEEHFAEIQQRLHRHLPLTGPHHQSTTYL